jgi:hypothetical protein
MRLSAEGNRGRIRGVERESTGWGVHYGRKPVRRDSAREAFNRHAVDLPRCLACGEHQCSQSSPDEPVVLSVWQLLRVPVPVDGGDRRMNAGVECGGCGQVWGEGCNSRWCGGHSAIDPTSSSKRDRERSRPRALR